MNKIEEMRTRDLKQANKISKIEEIKCLFLDNYRLWTFVLVGFAVIIAYPKTVVSILSLFGGVMFWIYNIIVSLSFPMILIIIAVLIFVAGSLRKPKGLRPINRF